MGREVGSYEETVAALLAAEELGATPGRWVNEGFVDAEYAAVQGGRWPPGT